MTPGSPFKELQRILAIRLDNIGDVVMLSPALRALHEAFPAARMTLMASPAGSQVAPLLPWVDEVITWRAIWQDINKDAPITPEKEYELVQILKQHAFDAAFIFTSFSQSPHPPAYACYLAQIPIRVGQSKEFGGELLSHWIKPPADEGYQVERNLHLLREAGIPVDSNQLELQVPPAVQQTTELLLAQAGIQPGQAYIALAPGASAAARRYDETRIAQVAKQVAEQAGMPVVLIGSQREIGRFPAVEAAAARSAAEAARSAAAAARSAAAAAHSSAVAARSAQLTVNNPGIISLIGKTSVAEMADVIRRSALLIGNNSGSLHIAEAFDRPMVILYSGTEVLGQWVSPHSTARLLNRPVPCSPCYAFQCPYQMECLDIPVEEVVAAALSQIKTNQSLSSKLAHPLASGNRR